MNPVESLVSNTIEDQHDQETSDVTGPVAKCEEVRQCQFSTWYPKFSNLEGHKRKNVTINSVIIKDLPAELEDYLLSDGVKLPVGADKLSSCGQGNTDWSSDEEQEEDDAENDESLTYHFPQLNRDLENAIASLKGAVMPKLNWSSPKDATWVNGGTTKSQTPGDVFLLLKSSDFCLHDVLRRAWKECSDYDEKVEVPKLEIVLRKWSNLHPSMEFRCFVKGQELVAISQRNHTQHYPHLMQDRNRIQELLVDFFEDTIREGYAIGQVSNYVFDAYVDQKDRVWLLDFNLWATSTDSLLFDWPQLMVMDVEDDPDFRVVETANQVRQDPLASYRAPVDTVDLASMTGGDAKNFEGFMKQCQRPSEIEASEHDDDKRVLDSVD